MLVVVLAGVAGVPPRARRPPARRTTRTATGLRDRMLTFAVGADAVPGHRRHAGGARVHATCASASGTTPTTIPNALRVEVTARQWSWTFRTAGPDGRFATPDDVVTLNELHVPIGRPIYFKLRSKDVVHSLYLPNFRTKIDAIPGSTTRLWFQAQEAGRYEIGCAQHCGVSHYKMRGWLIAAPDDEYSGWLARAEIDSRLRYETRDPTVRRRQGLGRRLGLGDRPVTAPATPDPDADGGDDDRQPIHAAADRLPAPVRLLHRSQGDRPSSSCASGWSFLAVGGVMAMLIRWQLAQPRAAGAARGPAAVRRLRRRDLAGGVHVAVHDARHDHDLLRGHADPDRRLRQLLHPAADRRARHGVPAPQHAVVLDVGGVDRDADRRRSSCRWAAAQARLDGLRAAVDRRSARPAPGQTLWTVAIYLNGVVVVMGAVNYITTVDPAARARA